MRRAPNTSRTLVSREREEELPPPVLASPHSPQWYGNQSKVTVVMWYAHSLSARVAQLTDHPLNEGMATPPGAGRKARRSLYLTMVAIRSLRVRCARRWGPGLTYRTEKCPVQCEWTTDRTQIDISRSLSSH